MRSVGSAHALEQHVRSALNEHSLARKTLLVAVSGGPDSLALLHALNRLTDEFDLTLRGAHLNHRLRGAESDADACFVADTFTQLGIPFTLESADVASYRAKHRLSLEDAARRVRYAFLASAAADHNADAIALGHTSDDQAETLIMHIIRGSGLDGLRGMQTLGSRVIEGRQTTLFRPMLEVSRAQTQAYCSAFGLKPRMDVSNSSPEFMRNRIRMELLPLMEQFNPSVRAALLRLAKNAAQDSDYIRARADEVWHKVARANQTANGHVITLDSLSLSAQPPAIQAQILRYALEEIRDYEMHITQRHIVDMMCLLDGAPSKTLHLPGGLIFVTGYGEATVGSAKAVVDALAPLPQLHGKFLVSVPGEMQTGLWHVKTSVETRTPGAGSEYILKVRRNLNDMPQGIFQMSETLDLDSVGNKLWVRARTSGDRFQPLGMAQSKSLREFMIDARIPRRWRNGLPLLVSERGIVCIPGWRIAHWARITQSTKRVLRIVVTYNPR